MNNLLPSLLMFNTYHPPLLQIECDQAKIPPVCGNARVSITSDAPQAILITSQLIWVEIGRVAWHCNRHLQNMHFPHGRVLIGRLAPLSSVRPPWLVWNKGQVIRHLEGQLICHPLINASMANLSSRDDSAALGKRLTDSKLQRIGHDKKVMMVSVAENLHLD